MSEAEDLLAFQLKAVGIPYEREVVFAPPRKFRADFILDHCGHGHSFGDCCRFLIEVDGGTWSTSRHTTGTGFQRDAEKLNRAAELGYRVLRYTPSMVEDGSALAQIERCLGASPQAALGSPDGVA